jgi:hypothetical protein
VIEFLIYRRIRKIYLAIIGFKSRCFRRACYQRARMREDCLSNFPVCLFLKPAFYAPGKLLLRPKTLAPHDRIAKHEHLQRLAGGGLKVAGTIRARAV